MRSDEFVVSRREAMSTLMSLSDEIAATERVRQQMDSNQSMQQQNEAQLQAALTTRADPEMLAKKVPAEFSDQLRYVVNSLAEHSEDLDDDDVLLVNAAGEITWAQFLRMIRIDVTLTGRRVDALSAELSVDERRLRDRLRLIAEATDEERDQ